MSNPFPLHIQLFGNFRLLAGDAPITSVNTPRLQALLAYLVLHRDAPPLRQQLAFQLWPDSSETQARTNLRKLFFQLQRALPDADRFLVADTQTLGWNAQAEFTLDVAELQQRLIHLQKEPLDLEALRRVVELYQGELLPSCYDDWIAPLRQQLHQFVMDAFARLITLLENQRAYEAGIRYAERLLAFDPLEEKTYQRLMRLHALDGDYTGALRVYQECVAMLQRELDVEPDAETQALYARLRQRDAALVAKPEHKLPEVERLRLVGRQHEWQRLQHAWREAVRGQAHLVCIWGEAGIGKTHLAEELLTWADQQGVLTARTRSYQTQGALAYAPVVELLRSPAIQRRLIGLGDIWLSEVARLLPEFLEVRPTLPQPQPMTENWQRQRFFEALARAVLVDEQPLLLIFDDLHWCDQETLAWLHYFLHFARSGRLLVVGTSRIEEVDAEHPLTTLHLGLRREALVTEIELTPLSIAEVTALAQAVSEHERTPEQTEQLYADTEGNPLFVVETVRAILGGGSRPEGSEGAISSLPLHSQPSTALPPKVHAVIHARLTQLSPAAQKIASLAAVIGRSFTFTVLIAAAHAEEDTLIDSLDELGERRILREQGADGYDFSHDRIREVAYAELSRARRRQLHRHVAEALQTVYASSLDEISGPLAEHYEQAGDATNAVHYLQRAGERAAQIYAYREALTFYNRALALEKTAAGRNQLLQSTILIKMADIHIFLAEYPLAQQLGEESLALARVSADQKILADSLRILGAIALGLSEYAKAKPLYQQVLALYQHMGERKWEADILCRQGDIAYHQGKPGEATQLYEQAMVINKELGDRRGEAHVIFGVGAIAEDRGEYSTAKQLYQQALLIYQEISDRSGEASVLILLGRNALGQGDYSQATQLQQQALLILHDIGNRQREAFTLISLAELAWSQAEYPLSMQLYQQAFLIYRNICDLKGEGIALLGLGLTNYALGDYAKAIQLYEQSLLIYQERDDKLMLAAVLNYLGYITWAQGEYGKAAQLCQQALEIFRDIDYSTGKVYAMLGLGPIAVAQGEYAAATQLYQQALTITRNSGERSEQIEALNGLGDIARIQGEYAQAIQLYQQALAICQDINHRSNAAKVLLGLGEVATEQGKFMEATQLLQQALAIPKETGERSDEAKALHHLGYVACGQQAPQVARRYFCEALSISLEIGLMPVILSSLVGMAQVLVQEKQSAQALQFIALSLHAPQTTADTKKRATRLLSKLEAEMPAETVTALLQAGAQLNLEQVVQNLLHATE